MMARKPAPIGSRRGFARSPDGQLHYRTAGKGTAVVLIGAVPTCVRADDPLFFELAVDRFVLAVDPPGHGLSDPPRPGSGLAPVIDPLAALIDALACGSVAVVGEGQGGALALALLDARPDLVARVVLRDLPDAETGEDAGGAGWVTPAIDGTHLIAQWDRIARAALFRPQSSSRYADRVLIDMPSPSEHHARLIDALRAGSEGERLRLALKAFDRDAVWARHGDRIACLEAGTRAIDWLPPATGRQVRLPESGPRDTAGFGKYLIDVPGGQLMARGRLDGDGVPLLGLHDQAGSSYRLDVFLAPFLGSRPVVAIDMPGSGGSDAILAPDDVSIEHYATAVEAALQTLGIETLDVIGRYAGGQTAVELALRRPGAVRHVVNAGVMIFAPADAADHIAHYAPSFAPVWDGSHLVTAWMAFRSQNLWWPWYERRAAAIIRRDAMLDPQVLHDRIVGALAAGPFYRAAYLASFRYPMADRLQALRVPCLLCDIADTASYARVAQAKAAAPACHTADLGEDPAAWPALLESFFVES